MTHVDILVNNEINLTTKRLILLACLLQNLNWVQKAAETASTISATFNNSNFSDYTAWWVW